MENMRRVKLTSGPLKGKTVLVHETQSTFTTHAAPGHYEITETGAKWRQAPKAEVR
ncbi:hypothetical protein [Microbacterium sp. NPDC056052]|uniref:hypothetical protein n=1 Tax=Microbacterium sp. NPDC056052 TaxID=3345695 RepID=UPI0035E1E58B